MKRITAVLAVLLPAVLLASCGRMTLPQSPALKWLEHMSGRIAVVGPDGNIRVMDQAGGGVKDVTSDAVVDETGARPSFYYEFPAWSRDARALAFVGVRRTAEAVQDSGIWTSRLDGKDPSRIYSGDEQVARLLSWAPDSSRLVFVTGGVGDKRLQTVPARGGDARVLRSGVGFSWRWETRGARLAVHSVDVDAGGPMEQVAILDPRGTTDETDFSQSPGRFDAPAWSADGSIIMAVSDPTGSTLYREDSGGSTGQALAHVEGTTILDLSPDGRRLAWAAPPSAGHLEDRSLYVMDLASPEPAAGGTSPVRGEAAALSGDDYVAAFFWSPDGRKIAYFVPRSADDALTLKVLTVKTGLVRTVASFTPSLFFLSMLNQFGQYAESVCLWSPDSRMLLYCATQPDSFDVMVAYAQESIEPRKVADGMMASWSPR